jgi:hypothetical protein
LVQPIRVELGISTSLDAGFCCSALDRALRQGRPEIFNTDQGGNSPAKPSPVDSKPRVFSSAWMDVAVHWTTFLCGELSNTKTFI